MDKAELAICALVRASQPEKASQPSSDTCAGIKISCKETQPWKARDRSDAAKPVRKLYLFNDGAALKGFGCDFSDMRRNPRFRCEIEMRIVACDNVLF